MARFKISPGLDEYTRKLQQLGMKTREELIGKAVFASAGIVADEMRASIQSLDVSERSTEGVTEKQKQGLLDGLGISRMKDEGGFINVKIGFNGYNGHVSAKYPKGQPNAMIARSLEKGTSHAPAQPFAAPAVKRSKPAAENAMKDVIESGIEKIMS